jgi:hypothetical protein
MSADQLSDQDVLAGVRAQRTDLHGDLVRLEAALAAALPGRVHDWAVRVHDALVDVGATFERHIAVTEGPGGLFDDITRVSPRLANAVSNLQTEHRTVRAELANELEAVRALHRSGGDDQAAAVRDRISELLSRLTKHRQRGSDLVYEAYAVDLGAGD